MNAEGLNDPGLQLEAAVFLVESERSGTTLLRLTLDHHPEVAFESEFDLVVRKVSDTGGLPPLHDYLDWSSD